MKYSFEPNRSDIVIQNKANGVLRQTFSLNVVAHGRKGSKRIIVPRAAPWPLMPGPCECLDHGKSPQPQQFGSKPQFVGETDMTQYPTQWQVGSPTQYGDVGAAAQYDGCFDALTPIPLPGFAAGVATPGAAGIPEAAGVGTAVTAGAGAGENQPSQGHDQNAEWSMRAAFVRMV